MIDFKIYTERTSSQEQKALSNVINFLIVWSIC